MQLILQTGAHYTEQERLIKSVLRNKEMLAQKGVIVPGPNSYRALMRDTLNALGKAPASAQARDVLLDVMLDGQPVERLVLSDANFFRTAGTAFQRGVLYPDAAERMANMVALFPEDDVEIFLGLRNPATLIPLLFQNSVDNGHAAFWGGRAVQDVRWSDTIADIRAAVPNVPMTIWCSEDMPVIWAQIIRQLCALAPDAKITGGFDLLSGIMIKEGMERFRAYLQSHPEMTEAQKHRVIIAFLDKFALTEAIEEELDMPGWTDAIVEELTDLYDQDVELIERMSGVTMIAP